MYLGWRRQTLLTTHQKGQQSTDSVNPSEDNSEGQRRTSADGTCHLEGPAEHVVDTQWCGCEEDVFRNTTRSGTSYEDFKEGKGIGDGSDENIHLVADPYWGRLLHWDIGNKYQVARNSHTSVRSPV